MYWPNGMTEKEASAVKVEMHGREPENRLIGIGGNDVFLEQQLQGVGDGLQQAVRADAHGAEAHLEIGQNFALHQHDVARHQREYCDHHDQYGHGDEQGVVENGVHNFQIISSTMPAPGAGAAPDISRRPGSSVR